MKIKKMVGLALLVGLVTLCHSMKVNAIVYEERIRRGDRISNIYVTKINNNENRTWVDYVYFINRLSDGHFVYCIQPGVSIDSAANYYGTDSDFEQAINLSYAQRERIKLLAYYGYNYNANGINHTEDRWYAITQMLIWQEAGGPGWDIYFTDRLDGNRLNDQFRGEALEIEALIANHFVIPEFGNNNYQLELGSAITLTDNNDVLGQFSLTTNSNKILINQEGNNLTITTKEAGNVKINFTKQFDWWQTSPIVYVNPTSQNVLMVGKLEEINSEINIEVYGGKVLIKKTGEEMLIKDDNFFYQEINLPKVTFGLYDEQENLLLSAMTDEKGELVFENLIFNKTYFIKETASSGEHLLDPSKYYFTIKSDNEYQNIYHQTFELKNYLPKGQLNFTKIDAETELGISGTYIEIYTADNQLIATKYTDAMGKIIIEDLLIGSYYIKEKMAKEGYYLTDEVINFTLLKAGYVAYAKLINTKIPVLVTVVDEIINEESVNIDITVPNTGINKTSFFCLASSVCLPVRMETFIYGKKIKKTTKK